MRPLVFATICLMLVLAGCSKSDQDGQSVTEKKRPSVPAHVAQFLIEGQRAYERGVYQVALAMTDSVEKYEPDLADLHFLRGAVYTQLNRLEVAQAAYQAVLEVDPAYKGARYNMGLNAFRRGKLRDAIDLYLAEQELASSSNLYLELGRAYAKLGEPDSARHAYEQAIAMDSTNATAFMWLGQLLEETGDLEEALHYSKVGLNLKPDNLDYQYIIGTQLFRTEKADEALPFLEPVAMQRPWHHGAQFNLGQVYMRLGREDDARVYFARADSAQQLQQKINEAQDAINRDPETLDNWVNLGQLLRRAGQRDRAIEAYKVAVTFAPWNLHLQNNLAILLMENGDTDTAIRRYQAILRADSTMTEVWLNLGVAYANSGRADDARAAWQKILSLEPGHRTARNFLDRLDDLSVSQ